MNKYAYAAMSSELLKIAANEVSGEAPSLEVSETPTQPTPAKSKPEHPAATFAKGIGGYALGAGLGYTGAHLADRAIRKYNGGNSIPPDYIRIGAPILGGAAGLGLGYLNHKMLNSFLDHQKAKESTEVPSDGLL